MLLDSNKIKTTPKHMKFGFCVFGEPSDEVKAWSKHWNMLEENLTSKNSKTGTISPYTNYYLPAGVMPSQVLYKNAPYEYVDGFSPNLNKYLHLGHLSNLILAKAYQSMQIGKKYVSILGDTLEETTVKKEDALSKYLEYCQSIGYKIDQIHYASQQKLLDESILMDGVDAYEGTKVFSFNGEFEVGIKSEKYNFKTSYTYQDVAFAQKLNAPTLYLTGLEQDNHFKKLETMFRRSVDSFDGTIQRRY
jgi:hypothetical protein